MDLIRTVDSYIARLWGWFRVRATSPSAQFWLFVTGFIDSFVFFFPPEALLAAMVTAARKYVVRYTAICLVSTFLGALVAYGIGVYFFDTIGLFLIGLVDAGAALTEIQKQFLDNAFLIIFLAMWTPIPSVPIVISAGFFAVPMAAFIPGVILGRAVRFVAISALAYYLGDEALRFFSRYARIATIGVVMLVILYVIFKLFY